MRRFPNPGRLRAAAALALAACASPSGVEQGEDGLTLLWKRPLGWGYSRLVPTDGGRLVTMLHEDGRDVVVALAAADGSELWRASYPAPFDGDGYGPGPNAAPVPVAGGGVLAQGAGGRLSLVGRSGELVWQRDLVADYGAEPPDHGYASSPVLWDGAAIAAVGGPGAGAVAWELEDGAERWRAGEFQVAYASPVLVDGPRGPFVLFNAKDGFVALEPDDGRELWRLPHPRAPIQNTALAPVQAADDLFWTSVRSAANDSGSRAFELGPDGFETLYWDRRSKVEPYANAVARDGIVYACFGSGRAGRLAALDARTGELRWEVRGDRAANVTWAGEELVVLGDEGALVVGEPTTDGFVERCRALLETERTWTRPTVVEGRVYVRDREHVWAYRLAPPDARRAALNAAGSSRGRGRGPRPPGDR